MGLWKQGEGRYAAIESKYGIDFREDHPDLFAKLSDGRYLKGGVTLTEGGYEYSVKELVSKKTGKPFVLVERKKVSVGEHATTKTDNNNSSDNYADGAKKGHEENLAAWNRQTLAIEEQTKTLKEIADALKVLANHVSAVGFK